MSATIWRRVSRTSRCPVCGRADWCLVSIDGTVAICPRTESGRRAGDAGYLHRLADDADVRVRRARHVRLTAAGPDFGPLGTQYRAALDAGRLYQLACQIGLSEASLTALGVGWSATHKSYTFPMVNVTDVVVGIRLRTPDGRKLSVRGGREGLFLPPTQTPGERLLVCEGPTDAAALLDLGFDHVAGRPSCTGGVKLLCELVRHRRPADVVIVADADGPGRAGADNLAGTLVCYTEAVKVIAPTGHKDVRDFLRAGGTRAAVETAITAAPVRRLRICSGRAAS
jgi:hypothetical protein